MKKRYMLLLSSVTFDLLSSAFSLLLAFIITGKSFGDTSNPFVVFSFLIWPAILVLAFYIFKIYSVLWCFSNFTEFARLFIAEITATFAFFISLMAVFRKSYTLNFFFVNLIISYILILFFRLMLKSIISRSNEISENPLGISGNIMIIGAGSAASLIINEFDNIGHFKDCKIKCVIDDDHSKKGNYISGIKIIGGRESIISAVEKYSISVIIFAIPSCTNEQKYEILNICQQTNCELKIVPSIYRFIDVESLTPTIRKVEIEDLLGRDPVQLDIKCVINYVSDKTVLVTGGGGSIGSELCRQIARHKPKQLIIFDVYENNAYDIQNELKHNYPQLNLVTLIGSVRDSKRLKNVFAKYKPDIVYHAAAHKHVPLMEDSPNETIKNNVFGTLKTVQCASEYKVKKFILISTDKAVNPTNIMGASKRICEMIIQSYNNRSETEFMAVRFGNVLGSNGSVIPLFKKQIENGGPITVTDPNIIRYFMTIPEAVSLVLQAGACAKGGEIFVLDMGKPVKILTLAENLIKLSGLTPYKDINIEFIGLRPGEKLYEEMLMAEESLTDIENGMIHIGKPIEYDEDEFFKVLEDLRQSMYDESIDIRALIKQIVPTYRY